MSTVLIADPHPVTSSGISNCIKNLGGMDVVGMVSSEKKLFKFLKSKVPDILIIEVDLPDLNGINAIRHIKTEYPSIKILVFSCHPEEMYALSSIKAGAVGYISKTVPTEILETAIHQVSRGGIYLNKSITERINSSISKGKSLVAKFKKLSTREAEVLNLLSTGKRNKDIAEALAINEKTVSTYKTRLLKKLRVDNLADLITQSRLLQLT